MPGYQVTVWVKVSVLHQTAHAQVCQAVARLSKPWPSDTLVALLQPDICLADLSSCLPGPTSGVIRYSFAWAIAHMTFRMQTLMHFPSSIYIYYWKILNFCPSSLSTHMCPTQCVYRCCWSLSLC